MGIFLFLTNNLLVFYICSLFSKLIFKQEKLGRRFIASLSLIPIFILFTLLILAALKSINAINVCIILLVISAVLFYLRKKQKNSLAIIKNNIPPDYFNSPTGSIFCGIFFSVLILYTAKTCFLGTCFIFDDYSYHAASCAHWIKDAYFSLKPFSYHAYYPFNSELISLWLMLPFKNDSVVFLAGYFWIFLLFAVSALFVLPEKNGKIKMYAVISLIILSNVIHDNAKSFSAVDLSCSVMTLCAIYMIGKKQNNKNILNYALSGLFLGFAIGGKISFLPIALIFFTAILTDKSNPANQRIKNFILFISCMALTGSFWYIRNFILTGNPLYPAEFLFFKGAISSDYLNRTKLVYWLTSSNLNLNDYLSIIKHHFNWPYSLGILSLCGYLSYPFVSKSKKNRLYTILFFTGLIFMAFYPFTPFSGTINKIEAPLRLENRFIILPFLIGIILSCLWVQKNFITLLIFLALIFADKKILLGNNLLSLPLITAITVTCYFSREKLGKIFPSIFKFKWIIYALFLLFILILIPYNKKVTRQTIKNYGHTNQPIGKGWDMVNVLPDNSTITYFGESTYQYYPLFRRDFNLIPIAVSENGSEYLPLHKRNPIITKKKELISNLKHKNINYVFVSKKIDSQWPVQYSILSQSNEIKEIYNDGCSAILELNNE